jgi:23S rRNA G2069 N7-methylase RlmK/C1962 C5-methylase RlmI
VTADRDVFLLPAPGGTLVMAACSSRVSAGRFFATVNRAAQQAGRPLHEIDRTGHVIDTRTLS